MFYVIAIVIGAVLGVAGEGGFGLFVGGVLGWLVVRVSRQQQDLAVLRESISALRAVDAAVAVSKPQVAPVAAELASEQPAAVDVQSDRPLSTDAAPTV
ncbi:MAG: hypothetical protein H7X95_10895, partial [Deltaproteobacteria bacterium]|nr:hypothetical protein [Deltaproteobacteria bacterium]